MDDDEPPNCDSSRSQMQISLGENQVNIQNINDKQSLLTKAAKSSQSKLVASQAGLGGRNHPLASVELCSPSSLEQLLHPSTQQLLT